MTDTSTADDSDAEFSCDRRVSLHDILQGDATARDVRDARIACGCVVCGHTLRAEGVVGRETLSDL